MIIISHRGNISGPELSKENHPEYIDKAITLGFDVEVDVWWDQGTYLGHDGPEYKISKEWLLDRKDHLWIHCKNLEGAYHLAKEFKCFCSDIDPYCFMSQGHIWVNDVTVRPPQNCVVPLLGLEDIHNYQFKDAAFAICTDYPLELL
tara:strand:- start:4194 stop:4634 length:441 start_codon:yes stop_codon:yes gene_type:complete